MRIDLSDAELQHLIRAVEHYDAYLLSQNRPEAAYAELLKLLKRLGQVNVRIARASTDQSDYDGSGPLFFLLQELVVFANELANLVGHAQ